MEEITLVCDDDLTSANLLNNEEQFVIYLKKNEDGDDPLAIDEDTLIKDTLNDLGVTYVSFKSDNSLCLPKEVPPIRSDVEESLDSFLILSQTSSPIPESDKESVELRSSPDNECSPKKCYPLCERLFSDLDGDVFNEIELEEERELRIYLEKFDDDEVVQCPKCPIHFAKKSILEQHYALHLVQPPYICPSCEKHTKNASSLLQHFFHHTDFPFICHQCDAAFRVKDDLVKHAFQHPACLVSSDASYQSFVRTLTFKNLLHEFLVKQHLYNLSLSEEDTVQKNASIEQNQPSFILITNPSALVKSPKKSKKNFKKRRKVSKSQSSKPQKIFKNDVQVSFSNSHIELEEEKEFRLYLESCNDAGAFQCPNCPVKYISKSLLEYHYASHMIKPPYMCPICKKLSKKRHGFIQHIRQHTEFPVICKRCKTAFKEKDQFEMHFSFDHSDTDLSLEENEYRIITFKNILHEFLIWHSRLQDPVTFQPNEKSNTPESPKTKKPNTKTSIVPLKFYSTNNPVELAEEREIRLFLLKFSDGEIAACRGCQAKFANKTLLEQHYMCHLIKPPLVCPVCDRKFKGANYFINHLRHHAKSSGCPECHLMFRLKKELHLHLSTHYGKNSQLVAFDQKFEGKIFKKILHEFWYRQSILRSTSPL